MLAALEAAAVAHVTVPDDDLRVPIGARTLHDHPRRDRRRGSTQALDANAPVNKRRDSLKGIVQRDMMRRYDRDDVWEKAPALRAALTKAWPTQQPIKLVDQLLPGPSGKTRQWTVADQFLVDEANSLLVGTPFTYGHVVVDEAQDHSAVALRCIGRRSPAGSMTILGDLAQSTTPAGQQRLGRGAAATCARDGGARWRTSPSAIACRRPSSTSPTGCCRSPASPRRPAAACAPRAMRRRCGWSAAASSPARSPTRCALVRHRHHNTRRGGARGAARRASPRRWRAIGLHAVDRVHDLGHDDVPVFHAEAVKGLEFDGVVVVNPHEIFDGSERGARLLYVAMTRAVQVLHFVVDAPLPRRSSSGLQHQHELTASGLDHGACLQIGGEAGQAIDRASAAASSPSARVGAAGDDRAARPCAAAGRRSR